MRRRGERNVAFAAEQTRCRVEADPAGAGQIHFRPGVQIGEVDVGAGGAVERFDVGPQLNQITGDKARRQADMAQDLNEEPCRVAARSGTGGKRLFGRLHARLHPHHIFDQLLQTLIELDQKVDRVARLARDRADQFLELRSGGFRPDESQQILVKLRLEFERPFVRGRLDEKVERIDDLHVGREVDRDREFGGLFREDKPRQPIAVRVLLPIHVMLRRRDSQRVIGNARAAVWRGPQAHNLRAEIDRPVIGVAGRVMKPDKYGHGYALRPGKWSKKPTISCNFWAAD